MGVFPRHRASPRAARAPALLWVHPELGHYARGGCHSTRSNFLAHSDKYPFLIFASSRIS